MSSLNIEQINFDDDDALKLLQSLPSMVLVLDEQFNVKFANGAFCNFVDKPTDDVLNKNFINLLPRGTGKEIEQ